MIGFGLAFVIGFLLGTAIVSACVVASIQSREEEARKLENEQRIKELAK